MKDVGIQPMWAVHSPRCRFNRRPTDGHGAHTVWRTGPLGFRNTGHRERERGAARLENGRTSEKTVQAIESSIDRYPLRKAKAPVLTFIRPARVGRTFMPMMRRFGATSSELLTWSRECRNNLSEETDAKPRPGG